MADTCPCGEPLVSWTGGPMIDSSGVTHSSGEYMGCSNDHRCRQTSEGWTIVQDEPISGELDY